MSSMVPLDGGSHDPRGHLTTHDLYGWLMSSDSRWPTAGVIETAHLTLEPLRVEHADEMAPLLDDRELHEYTGGRPATRTELRGRYARQVVGHSADGARGWLNWVVRHRDTAAAVGTVQATLREEAGGRLAEIAWVVARPYQGHGYASEAAAGMAGWLCQHSRQGVDPLVAHIHPDHQASISVARRVGLRATDVMVDGETRWTS